MFGSINFSSFDACVYFRNVWTIITQPSNKSIHMITSIVWSLFFLMINCSRFLKLSHVFHVRLNELLWIAFIVLNSLLDQCYCRLKYFIQWLTTEKKTDFFVSSLSYILLLWKSRTRKYVSWTGWIEITNWLV